ncbi:Mitochondrial carrier protein CoAc1 [Orobanche gracilis]
MARGRRALDGGWWRANIVPSVAIGFTAYDMMKTWLGVPSRQQSQATSAA